MLFLYEMYRGYPLLRVWPTAEISMNLRRIVTFVIIILLFAIFRPSGFWKEIQRIWDQRETITRLLFYLVMAYLIYGLYELYSEGWFDQWSSRFGG